MTETKRGNDVEHLLTQEDLDKIQERVDEADDALNEVQLLLSHIKVLQYQVLNLINENKHLTEANRIMLAIQEKMDKKRR